jgi:hypothetical protein
VVGRIWMPGIKSYACSKRERVGKRDAGVT